MVFFIMIRILIGLSAIGICGVLYKRRQARLLREENQIRKRLGLPLLTSAEFEMQVEEKSVDYRGKINQHM